MRNTLIAFALLTALGAGATSAEAAPGRAGGFVTAPAAATAPVQTVQWYGGGEDWRWRRHEAWREREAWRRHEYWAHRRWACHAYGRCW